MQVADWLAVKGSNALLLDVRESDELTAGHIAGALNPTLTQLRHRHAELPKDRDGLVSCGRGTARTSRPVSSLSTAIAAGHCPPGTLRTAHSVTQA